MITKTLFHIFTYLLNFCVPLNSIIATIIFTDIFIIRFQESRQLNLYAFKGEKVGAHGYIKDKTK